MNYLSIIYLSLTDFVSEPSEVHGPLPLNTPVCVFSKHIILVRLSSSWIYVVWTRESSWGNKCFLNRRPIFIYVSNKMIIGQCTVNINRWERQFSVILWSSSNTPNSTHSSLSFRRFFSSSLWHKSNHSCLKACGFPSVLNNKICTCSRNGSVKGLEEDSSMTLCLWIIKSNFKNVNGTLFQIHLFAPVCNSGKCGQAPDLPVLFLTQGWACSCWRQRTNMDVGISLRGPRKERGLAFLPPLAVALSNN